MMMAKGEVTGNGKAPIMERDGEMVHHGRMSKVDRYKWRTDTKRGEYTEIPKGNLVVDDSYQRGVDEAKVKRIASEWSWPAVGALVVAKRPDGRYYVVDGQHRAVASRRRQDVDTLPCMVFEFSDLIVESQAFLDGNTNRKPLTAIDKFAARITTRDPASLVVMSLAVQSGREIRDSERGIKCVAILTKLAAQDEAVLRRIWPLVDEVCRDRGISEEIVGGLFYIEQNVKDESIMAAKWRSKIAGLGAKGLLDGIASARAFYKRGGPKVWAAGILNTVNHRLRNQLEIKVSLDGRPEMEGR